VGLKGTGGVQTGTGSGRLLGSKDFSFDFTAAAPNTYDHATGGGAFNDRTVGVDKDIVESLEGGDFKCGDIVTYLLQVTVDNTNQAGSDAPQTVEIDFSFLADTTGQSGVAHSEVLLAKVNYGNVENGGGWWERHLCT